MAACSSSAGLASATATATRCWCGTPRRSALLGFGSSLEQRARRGNLCLQPQPQGPQVKVALVWNGDHSAHVCIYSSETGEWGDVVSTAVQHESSFIVVGFWNVLGLDMGSQNLALIKVPSNVYANHRGLYLTTLANGGGLSLIVMSANLKAQLRERTPDCDGTARWMLRRTIELDKLLSLRLGFPECRRILGVDGDDNVMFVSTYRGVFMVHLETMQFEKIFETNPFSDGGTIHPFTTLYAPDTC